MIYFPHPLIEQWIMDDVNQGDLTTRILGIGDKPGIIEFRLCAPGRVSGIEPAKKILLALGIEITEAAVAGTDGPPGLLLLAGAGNAAALHQAWKAAQNVLEWSCGVAEYTAQMVRAVKKVNPNTEIATTRKTIPGTKLLALSAVLDGGGIIHRGGSAETVLLFKNHRNFLDWTGSGSPWETATARLKQKAPEKKIVLEAETYEEAVHCIDARADIVQLDKFSLDDFRKTAEYAANHSPGTLLSAAGGVNQDNAPQYAAAGAGLIVTSAPYYAKPADVKVVLRGR
ncbi:MAG: ModD protein [Spirochaetaceae bacterium]|jgi:molybdenum transport protein|nr:ModD protein [Spirochaetaceae bacterium]